MKNRYFVVLFVLVVVAAALAMWSVQADASNGTDKVEICHVPPGQPENAHTIEVAESAVETHLAHGDTLGACAVVQEPEVPEQPDPLVDNQMDQRKDCDGIFVRFWKDVSYYVWNEASQQWVLQEPVVEEDSGWVHVRDLVAEERRELGCDRPDGPVYPDPNEIDCEKYYNIIANGGLVRPTIELLEQCTNPPPRPQVKEFKTIKKNSKIQKPKKGEKVTYQRFNKNGKLVEQRVSKPMPTSYEQEGM